MLDIGKDSPESQFYKTYQIWAEISPLSIKSEALEKKIGMSYAIRKIVSNNIGLRVFPPEVAPVIKDPLNKLESAIKGGVPLDIFLCALLAPEPDQPQAIAMLIQALETPPVHKDRGIPVSQQVWDTVIMNCLKHVTKLPFEVNKATWLDWFKRKKR